MKLFSVYTALSFTLASLVALGEAKHEPLRDVQPAPGHGAQNVHTMTETKDEFRNVMPAEPVVNEIVHRFMKIYSKEIGRSSLHANVSSILRAERTGVRGEMVEKELDADGLGIDFVEATQSQQYRLLLLLTYQFDSNMVHHNRPYVTVMRLMMDCYNSTSDTVDAIADAAAEGYDEATPAPQLVCDVIDHADLPRHNESTKAVPGFIKRQIFHSIPSNYAHNHSLRIIYDAVEAQDLAFDVTGNIVANKDTMHYVRYRVQGGSDRDCVVAIEHTKGVNTLRYQDTVCFEDVTTSAAAVASSHLTLPKENAPMFVLIAAIAGACVAMLLFWRQRRSQRLGYSYLRSNSSKLSHVPGQQSGGTTNTDAAVAC